MKKAMHNRRNFLTLSGLFGVGLLGLSSGSSKIPGTGGASSPEAGIDRLKWWLGNFFRHAGESEANEHALVLIEKCGKDCATRRNLIESLAKMRSEVKDAGNMTEMMEMLKSNHIGDEITAKGNVISLTFNNCYCPIRSEGYISSPEFCHCSKGWVKTVYEAYLQKPVDVKMISAIGRGDSVCHFEITA